MATCSDWPCKEWDEPPAQLGQAVGSDSCSLSELSELGWEASPSSGLLPPSDAAAERCLRKRVEAGDRRAVFYLGQLHFDTGDFESARQLFATIAADNIFAQYQLGIMFFEGLGFEQDFERGFRLMLMVALSVPKSPEQQETVHKAQYNIARAYFMGFGVPSSEDDGRRWLDRAAAGASKLGSVRAQTMLAMLLARSDTLDLKQSFFWHSEATGNGSLESQGAWTEVPCRRRPDAVLLSCCMDGGCGPSRMSPQRRPSRHQSRRYGRVPDGGAAVPERVGADGGVAAAGGVVAPPPD